MDMSEAGKRGYVESIRDETKAALEQGTKRE